MTPRSTRHDFVPPRQPTTYYHDSEQEYEQPSSSDDGVQAEAEESEFAEEVGHHDLKDGCDIGVLKGTRFRKTGTVMEVLIEKRQWLAVQPVQVSPFSLFAAWTSHEADHSSQTDIVRPSVISACQSPPQGTLGPARHSFRVQTVSIRSRIRYCY